MATNKQYDQEYMYIKADWNAVRPVVEERLRRALS